MKPDSFIPSLISSLPSKEVRGKKRLQKFGYILKQAGLPLDAHFYLYDYGPFSADVARCAEILTITGDLHEDERPVGASGTYMTVYSLPPAAKAEPLSDQFSCLATELDQFPTVDLEIAATMLLFLSEGHIAEQAKELTKSMKPMKATPSVLASADRIVSMVQARNEKRSTN